MAKSPAKPAPQQGGQSAQPTQQQQGNANPAPQQQGQQTIRDWAAF